MAIDPRTLLVYQKIYFYFVLMTARLSDAHLVTEGLSANTLRSELMMSLFFIIACFGRF